MWPWQHAYSWLPSSQRLLRWSRPTPHHMQHTDRDPAANSQYRATHIQHTSRPQKDPLRPCEQHGLSPWLPATRAAQGRRYRHCQQAAQAASTCVVVEIGHQCLATTACTAHAHFSTPPMVPLLYTPSRHVLYRPIQSGTGTETTAQLQSLHLVITAVT